MNTANLNLTDIVPYQSFKKDYVSKGLGTPSSLEWAVRYRHENGLVASGAIVERRPNPASKRPQLFVVIPRFVAWSAGIKEGVRDHG